jgi:peptide/nickel transport system substrate-binding protein
MAELPSGTVTFLFTDVEGSTRLLKQLRDRYGELLADHRRILRAAFVAHGGQEIDTQGDSFFVAFRRASDAALAAGDAQRQLAAHTWPEGVELRVRMGLHTGEPTVGDEGYHGLGVHRAARIMAAGHGGQILLSQATSSVLEDDELPGIQIRDLGHHELKDIDRPEHIYQLDVDGLASEFPPLRTADPPNAYTADEAELEQTARAAVLRSRLGGRRLLVGVLAAVVLGVLAFVVLATTSDKSQLSHVDANEVGVINPSSGAISQEIPVGVRPGAIAVGEGAIWVANPDSDTVSRIDSPPSRVVLPIAVGSSPAGITTASGAVWVANGLDGTVSRIDPGTDTVVQRISVGNGPLGIAAGAGSIWVANTGDATITKIDATTGKRAKTLPIAATELAFGAGALWATQRSANRVVRIDPLTGSVVQPIQVGNGPSAITFGVGAVWVTNSLDGTVSRIDPETNSVAEAIQTGDGPVAVTVGAGGVWVSNEYGGTLTRIDPRTNRTDTPLSVGGRPSGLATAGGSVLVSVRQTGAGHRGGTLTVRMNRDLDSIDSAVAYDSTSGPILRITNDGLVALNQAGGLAGSQLVPDLAVSLPSPADDGRTYTFRLRPNVRYSNGERVNASDFRYALERDFKIGKLPVQYYDGIVGADRCLRKPKTCDLSNGIVADDQAETVAFHLVAPDPDLLYKLSLSFADAVPAGIPPRETGTHPLPATGPYMIASYVRRRFVRLVRNPYFHEWSQAAQPDGYPDVLLYEIGGTPDQAVDDVLAGKADAFSTAQSETPPSEASLVKLHTRYASQLHTNAQPATLGLFLNTRLPPFDNLDVRRAVNEAADRAATVRVAGGPDVAQATCQILPPHFPGYRPYCPYPVPNLAAARALVAASGTRGMNVTVWSWGAVPYIGTNAAKLLDSLGYRARVKSVGKDIYFGVIGDSRTKAQIGTVEWISDYPAASGFFDALFSCSSFQPKDPVNVNDAEFCDPQIDREIARASLAQAVNPDAARGLWERVDRQTVDQAPWVPLVTPKVVEVLSKRVGNYQYSPSGGMLVDQLWVR